MSEGRPSKRLKGQRGHLAWRLARDKTVFLRLLASDQVKFELDNPIFMRFEDVDYLTFNSPSASYLYYICACLFEVMEEDITLYFSEKREALKDDDDGWEPVEWEDNIQVGEYLVVFESGASRSFLPDISDHLVPNLDLYKVKPRKMVAAATEEHITIILLILLCDAPDYNDAASCTPQITLILHWRFPQKHKIKQIFCDHRLQKNRPRPEDTSGRRHSGRVLCSDECF